MKFSDFIEEDDKTPTLMVDVLERARYLLRDKKHWVQGADALDKQKQITDCRSDKAVCFCLDGALAKAAHDLKCTIYKDVYRLVSSYVGNINAFNDDPEMKHETILKTLDKIIKLERNK